MSLPVDSDRNRYSPNGSDIFSPPSYAIAGTDTRWLKSEGYKRRFNSKQSQVLKHCYATHNKLTDQGTKYVNCNSRKQATRWYLRYYVICFVHRDSFVLVLWTAQEIRHRSTSQVDIGVSLQIFASFCALVNWRQCSPIENVVSGIDLIVVL